MFRARRTKIVSTPVEEVLEVKSPEPVVEPVVVEEYVNLDYVEVVGQVDYVCYGKVYDYDGKSYDFEWDLDRQRLIRLLGVNVDLLVLESTRELLSQNFKALEKTVAQSLEEGLRSTVVPVLDNLVRGLKALEDKSEKPFLVPPVPRYEPKPVPAQVVRSEELIDVAEEDFAVNAMKFLQEDRTQDLGIDYMSL